jgi:hypothetical protein
MTPTASQLPPDPANWRHGERTKPPPTSLSQPTTLFQHSDVPASHSAHHPTRQPRERLLDGSVTGVHEGWDGLQRAADVSDLTAETDISPSRLITESGCLSKDGDKSQSD